MIRPEPPERLRCRFLVGADGLEGNVRKAVGLDFEAEKFEGRANRQMDARLTWRRSTDPGQLWFFYYHSRGTEDTTPCPSAAKA